MLLITKMKTCDYQFSNIDVVSEYLTKVHGPSAQNKVAF